MAAPQPGQTRRRGAGSSVLALGLVVLLALSALSLGGSVGAPAQPPPTLSVVATASPVAGSIPLTVAFAAQASNGFPPYSYTWSFGDGSPNVTGAFANHTFLRIDDYRVTVTAVDQMDEVAFAGVVVNATPTRLEIRLTAVPPALAAGQTTILETSVQGGLAPFRFAWSGLPDGCPSQPVENLSCSPTYGGSFVVNVTVTDARNVSASATVALVVSGPGPPSPPAVAPAAPNFTDAILAVAVIGAALVVAAALLGRRARRRRESPRP
jgi:PKD domain